MRKRNFSSYSNAGATGGKMASVVWNKQGILME
jgi:hypothetical protein